METRIALFQKKEIRKILHADEWWFVIVDVVAALTDSTNPAESLKKMRLRDEPLSEALKGGNLPPPCAGDTDGRRPAKTHLLAHRGYFPPDPVHPQPQSRERRKNRPHPATGLVAPEPNVSFWSDHALKRRWFALPTEMTGCAFRPLHRPTPRTPLIRRLTRRPVLVTFPIRVRGYSLVVKLHSSKVVSSVRF